MKVATGILVDGNVVLEGEASTEGATVTGVLREDPRRSISLLKLP